MIKMMFLVAAILASDGTHVADFRVGPLTTEQCARMLNNLSGGLRLSTGKTISEPRCVPAEEVK